MTTEDAQVSPLSIRRCIEDFFRAMDTQDLALMERVLAHDPDGVHVGTDTEEIWRGWDDLRSATIEQFETLEYYDAEISDLEIRFSASGEVAWYSHLLDARIKSAGEPEQVWSGARFTGVFERRAGRWKLVQTHVSLPESAAD